ncbi:MAG: GGDEF domain-containing protein, partial [Oscillospiraceae bacterium]|nr:GGDEF domain-containing protein [Oscillospiraceae bacterium]
MKRRFSVALFVGHMESKFSEEIFLGAAHAAESMDINLVVFPVRFLEEEHTNDSLSKKYHYQYNCMFSYAENHSFDAVILETAVMGRYVAPEVLSEIAHQFGDTPVVTISEKIDDLPCVSFETNGIDLEIDHLVNEHGRKRIGFVTGPSTNLEAVQRLEKYKEALERHGIPHDPKLIAEGDFTENCRPVIDKLLSDNPDMDAICFSNDLMAIAGYKEIEKRDLIIGKDILVTGFDDIPESVSLNPPLTTVRARYRDLGMNAVKAAHSILTGSPSEDITVKTKLVKRDSCGCKSKLTRDIEYLLTSEDQDINKFILKINDIITSYYDSINYQSNQRIIKSFLQFAARFLTSIRDASEPLDYKMATFKFEVLLSYHILDFIKPDNLNSVLSLICDKAVSLARDEETRTGIYKLFMDFFKQIISYEHKNSPLIANEIKDNVRCANSIIGNTIECFQSNNSIPANIMQGLKAMGIRSSYLYLHEKTVISKSRNDWEQPSHEMLYSYQTGGLLKSFVRGKKIRAAFLFRNEYMPDSRFTLIASPVFCSEENYGILLYDIDTDDYNFYNSFITSQISYALKLRNMLEVQKEVQSNLRESLSKATTNNERLNQISRSDELTGILNRRGFMERARSSILEHTGRRAAVIFADMDNLKQINDIFGHDEGDYARLKTAEILTKCIRTSDIVARFGGDEFAAFVLTDDPDFSIMLRNRIREACDHVNENSGKPYMIR